MGDLVHLRNPIERIASVEELHPYVVQLTAALQDFLEITEPVSPTPHVTSDGEILNVFAQRQVPACTVNTLVAQLMRLGLHSANSLKRLPNGEIAVLIPQVGYSVSRWTKMTSGTTLAGLSKREQEGLIGTPSEGKRVTVTVNDIVEPDFLRFGRIERKRLRPRTEACYVLVLHAHIADVVVPILEEMRRDCPRLVTNKEWMARESASEAVSSLPRTLDELEPGPLVNRGSRRSLMRALQLAGVDTTGMTSTANIYRLVPPGGMESRAAIVDSGRSHEIDLVSSYPTAIVALLNDFIKHHGYSEVPDSLHHDVACCLEAGRNLVPRVMSLVSRSIKRRVLPPKVRRWDNDLHRNVEVDTLTAVKTLMCHVSSDPYSHGGLSCDDEEMLCNGVPLLASYLQMWRGLYKCIVDHHLTHLVEEGHALPLMMPSMSKRISLVLTNIECRNMTALSLTLRDFLSRKGYEIRPGETKYRNDGLALSAAASHLFVKNTGWIGELNDEIETRCRGHVGFRVAFKKIELKRASLSKREIKLARISNAVLEMRSVA